MRIEKFVFGVVGKWTAAIVALVMAGCVSPKPAVPPPTEESLIRLHYSEFPEFQDDLDYDGLEHAISKSLSYLEKIPPDRSFYFGQDQYDTSHLIKTLHDFRAVAASRPDPKTLKMILQKRYRVYRAAGGQETRDVLFTGYFEPVLRGRLRRNEIFRFPLYALPRDLVSVDLSLFSSELKGKSISGRWDGRNFVPYFDREEIDFENRLAGGAEVLVWLDDPVDAFFLHVQGSGKVHTENGQVLNVHYHAANGRPYRSIGKYLIETGKISRSEMSMPAIQAYLKAHPDEIRTVLSYNPSYVFFKTESESPKGALGVVLTPGRSIATDLKIFPKASLAYVEAVKPDVDEDGKILQWLPMNRLMLNQDTGGAITGAGRADLFWGNGKYAEIAAGHMKHRGELYFLVLNPENES
jgi:membrane-bound lytic murein transglycosylase A